VNNAVVYLPANELEHIKKDCSIFFPTFTNPEQHPKAPALQHQDFQRERISAILPRWIIQTPE